MINRFEHSPWSFWADASDEEKGAQTAHLAAIAERYPQVSLGDGCFISTLASVHPEELSLGDRSYIAASAYLTDRVRIGDDCTVNPFCVIRGTVTMGDGVRIGAHTSILGFNHSMEPGVEVFRQPLTVAGITIGDDVWIGSQVVILDGVHIGDHAVIGAGAVVTKDVDAGAIVVGNPARRVRWRVEPQEGATEAAPRDRPAAPPRDPLSSTGRSATVARPSNTQPLAERAGAFADRARGQVGTILDRSWDAASGLFVDRPGQTPTVRAQCDAIELAVLLTGDAPTQLPRGEQTSRLRSWQNPTTGLVPSLGDTEAPAAFEGDVAYHVECVGYALDLLGSSFAHPIGVVTDGSAPALAEQLDSLPWRTNAWGAGHVVDALGSALLWSRSRGDAVPAGWAETLFGWLHTRADARSGMWGEPTPDERLLQPVNGFYRASRGTLAQFGVPVAHPEAVIDTVLRHSRDRAYFDASAQNACNVLDVAHPLWLTRDTGYRASEVRETAQRLLGDALDRWVDDEGIAFRAQGPAAPGQPDAVPGLQGTEMWLATIWYLADLAGCSEALGYRPRGIHRPEATAQV